MDEIIAKENYKCLECRHYQAKTQAPRFFSYGHCTNPSVVSENNSRVLMNIVGRRKAVPTAPGILRGRDICDREHDGHFVHFEPRYPSAGVTFRDADRERPPAPIKFRFADDEDRPANAMGAAA